MNHINGVGVGLHETHEYAEKGMIDELRFYSLYIMLCMKCIDLIGFTSFLLNP